MPDSPFTHKSALKSPLASSRYDFVLEATRSPVVDSVPLVSSVNRMYFPANAEFSMFLIGPVTVVVVAILNIFYFLPNMLFNMPFAFFD